MDIYRTKGTWICHVLNPKLSGEYKRRSKEGISLLATQAFSLLVLWSLRDWPKFQVRVMALVTWLLPASGKKGAGSLWEATVARPARDSYASLPVQQELVRGTTFRSLRWDFWLHSSFAFYKAKRYQYHQWHKYFTLLTFPQHTNKIVFEFLMKVSVFKYGENAL